MLENHLAFGVDDESHVEESILQVGMPSLGLRHDERVVFARDLAQFFGFFSGNVDGTFTRKLHMIEIEDFIVESLQSAFGKGDEAHGEVEGR